MSMSMYKFTRKYPFLMIKLANSMMSLDHCDNISRRGIREEAERGKEKKRKKEKRRKKVPRYLLSDVDQQVH